MNASCYVPDPPWLDGPPDQVESQCSGCREYLDEANCSDMELDRAYDEGSGRCHSCAGDDRCLVCGSWILRADAELDPLGCVMCDAPSRHGVEVRDGDL